MFRDITDNDLFDQNVGMTCAEVRLRCSWISLVLIYLIKIVAISNPYSKIQPNTVKFPIQINGLSNQSMPVLCECVSEDVS